jgi:Peptidase C39 family
MRPLVLDILDAVIPVAIGIVLFFGGRLQWRLPMIFRVLLVVVAIGIVAVGGMTLAHLIPREVGFWVSRIGGATVLLAWVAQFLLGMVWDTKGRSFSATFLVLIAVVAGCLIAVESSGRLWFRYRETELWDRYPDNDGFLQQSSGASCSPTAAAMLLHRYGIRVSEGEMAYLAGTSLFGTDAPAIARALRMKLENQGMQVVARHMNYDECARLGKPFIAHVAGSSSGHALLVERAAPDHVQIVDPAEGKRIWMLRAEFEKIWDGTVIYLERTREDALRYGNPSRRG